ncbi:hypothetical protein GUJ93_ZPchr0013g36390 [Zizania palustris]|uniref:Uncharacterized protein n=1 Tax=Zizania palustris TaxID=103762 RepID=A0A8J6BU40_ZIZPA|nr:hypothetical protein GUJ93_ZPchr0013g36390 [Zizania palustris]
MAGAGALANLIAPTSATLWPVARGAGAGARMGGAATPTNPTVKTRLTGDQIRRAAREEDGRAAVEPAVMRTVTRAQIRRRAAREEDGRAAVEPAVTRTVTWESRHHATKH